VHCDYLQVLESQRPTSRNFSVYLDAKKYQNNKNQKRSKEKKNNISHYNYKLKNNKENRRLPKETAASGKSEKMETLVLGGGGKSKFTSGEEDDNANFGRQSFAHKKLKNMHEQQQSQQEKERKRGDDGDLLGEYPPSQLFDAIEILNERKFNKPSVESTDKFPKKEQEKSRQVDEAIGDIEDNLDNDEALPNENENENENDDDEEGDDEDIKSAIDNDELAKKYPVATSATTKVPIPTTLATTETTSSSTTTATTPSTSTTPTTATPRTLPTIGRKLKRNFLGPSQPETRYYGSYDIGRIRASAVQEEDDNDDEEEEEEQQDVGELHYYDTSSNPRKLVTFDPEKSEENYLASYYAGKLNATEKKQQQQLQHVVAPQQHATRYVDDDYAEQQPPAEKSKPENPWEKSAEKLEEEQDQEQLEDGKLESDSESALQRYHEGKSLAYRTVKQAK